MYLRRCACLGGENARESVHHAACLSIPWVPSWKPDWTPGWDYWLQDIQAFLVTTASHLSLVPTSSNMLLLDNSSTHSPCLSTCVIECWSVIVSHLKYRAGICCFCMNMCPSAPTLPFAYACGSRHSTTSSLPSWPSYPLEYALNDIAEVSVSWA